MTDWLRNLLKGAAIGLANIIPGVSGGTMALVLGIYQRLIAAVQALSLRTVAAPFRGWQAVREEARRIDLAFLIAIGVGVIVAVVATAKVLLLLLTQQHDPTYGFFFGLVLVSVVAPLRLIRRPSAGCWIAGLIAALAVIAVTLAGSGETRLASAKAKAALKANVSAMQQSEHATEAAPTTAADRPASGGATAMPSGKDAARFFGAGAIAITAMILPGISGSFILLLLGVYFEVLAAVAARQLIVLGIFCMGCLLGMALATRAINFMLQRFHDATMAFLSGLVVGSLYAIWPFKHFASVAGERVDLANRWPAHFGGNEIATFAAAVIGAALVGAFLWYETRRQRPDAATSVTATGGSPEIASI